MYIKEQCLEISSNLVGMKFCISPSQRVMTKPFINIYVYEPSGKLRIQALYRGEEIICQVGKYSASPGCFKGEVGAGIWYIVAVGEAEEIELNYSIIPIEVSEDRQEETVKSHLTKERKWYCGDFHTHTQLSDGSLLLEEIPEVMKKNKLDFIFLTDHNIYPSHLEEYKGIFKGMEVTLPSGHMNVHGISENVLDHIAKLVQFKEKVIKGQEDVEDILKYVGASNISVNHPFMEPWQYTYEKLLLSRLNTLEIICDPTWHSAKVANEKALRFLHFLGRHGHRIVGIGGSDSHLPYGEAYEWADTPSWYGDPSTYVLAEACSKKAILEAVNQGRVYVSRKPKLEISINQGIYWPGADIMDTEVTYEIAVSDMQEEVYVNLMVNGKKKESKCLKPHEIACFNVKFKKTYECVSIEIRDTIGDLLAFVNPIYHGQLKPSFRTWGEAVSAFDKQEGVNV